MLTSTIAGALVAAALAGTPAQAPAELAPVTAPVVVSVGTGPDVSTTYWREMWCITLGWCK
ncbi:hypothetical protein [Isoptericola dokdonensis]|jgi:hypothetical protein|uniref:Uncharacterized protein n=1 Tax=Isoptericola dokdonensis DS-3 TaxID=1300344 RepID=A0A168FKC1_9MICO|nr:hypothetical protein [Isoptericola dokdonensis]ANC32009.1 hypothetical protein I598_2472 [Isoptericola dokdonensis DS-3]